MPDRSSKDAGGISPSASGGNPPSEDEDPESRRSELDVLISVLEEKVQLGTALRHEETALPELIEARAALRKARDSRN